MTVWAFNKVDDEKARNLLYQSIKSGKSRFGWSQKDECNLKLKNNWSEWHSRQLFLLEIKPGDWIVHINTPQRGSCIAAKVISDYEFDEGLQCEWGPDFRHCFEIDISSIIEFKRNDPNVLPTVNLNPRSRYQRVYAVEDFLKSIENLKNKTVSLRNGESKHEYHLKNKTDKYLSEITNLVHEMHKSKNLERFLAKVFKKVPGVIDVNENGFGWGTDFGADLIVTMVSVLGNLEFENKIIVQVKSYEDEHHDLEAVQQIKTGIEKYTGTAGLLITTGKKTESLENKLQEVSDELNKPIDLLSGEDVARFIIKHAPEYLFNLDSSS
ncbi:MAG TPA: restriction endonuclease [Spirochaetota bacterium]|nr:restriction endonuclease [Spirochaetota bacterium]